MAEPRLQVKVYANVTELKQALAEGTSVVATTTAAMQKLSTSLDGSKLVQQAHNVVGAIDDIGGVSKLTSAEAERLFGVLDRAIEKAAATGKTLPPEIHATAAALRDKFEPAAAATEKTLGNIWSGLKGAAGLVGITFSVGAIVNFTEKVFDAASKIHDQSTALGFTAEAFQRYSYAAEQSGASQDAFVRSAGILNDKLGEGDKSTVAALTKAGLKFDEIRAMRPDEAFLAVSTAVGKIQDPMLRANVAQDLFGKGARELLPGMIEGYEKLGASATVMSDSTVARLEAAQDAWERFTNSVVIHTGEVIASFADSASSAGSMSVIVAGYAGTSAAAMQATAGLADTQKTLSVATIETEKAMARAATASSGLTELTKEQEAADVKATEAKKKAADAAQRHAEQIGNLAERFSQTGLNNHIKRMTEELAAVERQGGFTKEGLHLFGRELDGIIQQGGTLPPKLHAIWLEYQKLEFQGKVTVGVSKDMKEALDDIGKASLGAAPKLDMFTVKVGGAHEALKTLKNIGPDIKELPAPPIDPWEKWNSQVSTIIGNISSLLTTLGIDIGGFGQKALSTINDVNKTLKALQVETPGTVNAIIAEVNRILPEIMIVWNLATAFLNWLGGGSAPRDSQQDPSEYDRGSQGGPPGTDPGNPTHDGDEGTRGGSDLSMLGLGGGAAFGFAGFGSPFGFVAPAATSSAPARSSSRAASMASALGEHGEGGNHTLAEIRGLRADLRMLPVLMRDALLASGRA